MFADGKSRVVEYTDELKEILGVATAGDECDILFSGDR
jgi:hypothetical protein